MITAGAIACAAPVAAQPAAAPRSDFTTSLGAGYWHGDYGAPTDTSITSALLALRYRIDGLRLTASLPRMRIRSDGTIFTGIGGTPLFVAPTVPFARRVRQGFGDLTLGAAYLLPGSPGGVDLELSGRVKLPTASNASLLSTGQTDYSAGLDISRPIGRLTPRLSATYRFFGDGPRGAFRNGVDLIGGVSYALPSRTLLTAEYEYTERASRLIGDSHELVFGASAPLGDRFRLSGYGSAGLSRGATDVSAGASIAVVF